MLKKLGCVLWPGVCSGSCCSCFSSVFLEQQEDWFWVGCSSDGVDNLTFDVLPVLS